jgi:hypothetical protein
LSRAQFDRETQREKNLEKAMKEARVKAKKDQGRKDEVGVVGGGGGVVFFSDEFGQAIE